MERRQGAQSFLVQELPDFRQQCYIILNNCGVVAFAFSDLPYDKKVAERASYLSARK
jgi:hypothetical protein